MQPQKRKEAQEEKTGNSEAVAHQDLIHHPFEAAGVIAADKTEGLLWNLYFIEAIAKDK